MAFSDPQTITINAVDKTCARVQTESTKSIYKTADEEVSFTLSHQASGNRTRHMARVDQRVVATDPLTATNEYKTLGCYLVIDEPEYGFTDVEINYVVQALAVWLSGANVAKVLGSEH